ncbi:MAG TPA: hypothetical protein VGS41_04410, partial [Chthonomonadales bacterium]|nr:hypothetical protein [Chthonomonadales bacterium]
NPAHGPGGRMARAVRGGQNADRHSVERHSPRARLWQDNVNLLTNRPARMQWKPAPVSPPRTRSKVGAARLLRSVRREMSATSCWQCGRYNREQRLCRDGKTNPVRKVDSYSVAELLGVRALCCHNPYRDGIAQRMLTPRAAPKAPLRLAARFIRRTDLEIEIEEFSGEDAGCDQ